MPTFKKYKNVKGKFTEKQVNDAVQEVLSNRMGLREAGRRFEIHRTTLRRYVL